MTFARSTIMRLKWDVKMNENNTYDIQRYNKSVNE